jgi:hypothetical protein
VVRVNLRFFESQNIMPIVVSVKSRNEDLLGVEAESDSTNPQAEITPDNFPVDQNAGADDRQSVAAREGGLIEARFLSGDHISDNPVAASRSAMACDALMTLMVVIPISRAGFRLTPRSSR